WHMNTFTHFQHGLAWLRWLYEKTIDGVLTRDASIDTVIDFGVLCADPDYRLSMKYPEKQFIGVDRGEATKRLNEAAYKGTNLKFVAANIDDELPSIVKKGTTMLFHARTGTLCYPQLLRDIYKKCAATGVKKITLFENNALDRRSFRYLDFDRME